jgi:hypothetical protein
LYFLGEKPWGHFCIFRGIFVFFGAEKVGTILYFLRGFLLFFGGIFGFSFCVFNMIPNYLEKENDFRLFSKKLIIHF